MFSDSPGSWVEKFEKGGRKLLITDREDMDARNFNFALNLLIKKFSRKLCIVEKKLFRKEEHFSVG